MQGKWRKWGYFFLIVCAEVKFNLGILAMKHLLTESIEINSNFFSSLRVNNAYFISSKKNGFMMKKEKLQKKKLNTNTLAVEEPINCYFEEGFDGNHLQIWITIYAG